MMPGVWFGTGNYFTVYRGKPVCLDDALTKRLEKYKREPITELTKARLAGELSQFIAEYDRALWWKTHTGQVLPVERVTFYIKDQVLQITPHYKVPDDPSMGSAPLHLQGTSLEVQEQQPVARHFG